MAAPDNLKAMYAIVIHSNRSGRKVYTKFFSGSCKLSNLLAEVIKGVGLVDGLRENAAWFSAIHRI